MEILVPLMPLFGTLPVAVAAVWIVGRFLKHRERMVVGREEFLQLREELETLRAGQVELQERLDFAERVLSQGAGPRG